MEKFIDFLDKYKSKRNLQYNDLSLILQMTNQHYILNSFNTMSYAGILPVVNEIQPPLNVSSSCSSIIPRVDYYEYWKQKHEIFNLPEIDVSKNEIAKIHKKTIEQSIDSLDDLLHIIGENEYKEDTEYNIDLKALSSIKDELGQLNAMIGMHSFKNSILDQILYFIQNLHRGKEPDFKNMILCGPPGTGKTEIAKILGKMYSKIGVLKNNIFKKVTRSDLVAGYLGQTAIKTKKVITDCLGGCLFIDEAYSLASGDREDSYSKECLDTLCEAMSEHKEDLMVIIAGYEDELYETFFRANKGLESRFTWRFKIDNYCAKELMQIYLKKVIENDWKIEIPDKELAQWFESKSGAFKYFGRDMELLFSYTKIAHGRRIYGKSEDLKKIIHLEDLDRGYKSFTLNSKKKEVPIVFGLYT
jgi:SpoVK/Ycf46/Vps4 family AAA+-type ATPase